MKPTRSLALALLLSTLLVGCDALDPTDVSNPRTTNEDLARADAPVSALIPGLRAQFARALGATVVAVAFGSDNYSINGTGVGGNDLDFPRDITPATSVLSGTGAIGAYWNLQELRALADFIIDDLATDDETATDEELAEAHYYRALAYLMQGENFVAVPVEQDGEPVPGGDLLQRAVSDLERAAALSGGGEIATRAAAGLARAYRALGDRAQMTAQADAALASGGEAFLFAREYDSNTVDNVMQNFLVDRSLQEAQPLPRLDFLDPKYLDDEAAIPAAKAEEMYLLLAEGALAAGDLGTARDRLNDAVALAAERPMATFEDGDERLDNDLNPRPRSAEIRVRADADSPYLEGLVLTRPGVVAVPTVSATSVTPEMIAAADAAELARLLYLARQEILFLEGRRLHDLGIRFPMMEREIDANPNIDAGDVGTEVFVPDYIPEGNQIDLYTPLEVYDGDGSDAALIATDITILFDLNGILAEQRGLVVANPLLP